MEENYKLSLRETVLIQETDYLNDRYIVFNCIQMYIFLMENNKVETNNTLGGNICIKKMVDRLISLTYRKILQVD